MNKEEYPSIKSILDYWHPKQIELGTTIDLWEPCCWGCNQFWWGTYDTYKRDYWRNWEKAPLQRCHITPKSLGGSLEPSNFVLLCKECHDLAPNTDYPDIMLNWMKGQSFIKRFQKQLEAEFETFGISLSLQEDFLNTFKSDEFKKWSEAHLGIHRPQSTYSGSGKRITLSTNVGLYKKYKSI